MKRILTFCAAAVVGLAAQADGLKYVTGDNVNMRDGASSSAKVVMKGGKGMVVTPIATEGTWTKVRTLPGTEMFISSQFLADLPDGAIDAYSCVMDRQEAEDALYVIGYSKMESNKTSEATATWIPMAEDNSGKVLASYKWEYADTSGRMQTMEQYYTGKKCGWYIELTDNVDYEYKNPEKLDTPIYIYPAYGTSDIYVNDERFFGDDGEWGD